MTATYVTTGGLDPDVIGNLWVLVLGGVTPVGDRKARRAVAEALESGFDVVWFDGVEEEDPDTKQRVPLDHESDSRLQIVGFREAESQTVAARLRSSKRLQANAAVRLVWRYVLRRFGAILRPRACWTIIRPDIMTLSGAPPPAAIVFGDDCSITSAWYAGRMWPDAPLSTQLQTGSE